MLLSPYASTQPVSLVAVVLQTALLLSVIGGCAASGDTGWEGEATALGDEHGIPVEIELRVSSTLVAEGVDLELDWSALHTSAWGLPIEPGSLGERVVLTHFGQAEPAELLDALAAGTLQRSDVSLEVECSSDEAHCPLSSFSFAAGHPIDMLAQLGGAAAHQGTWLLSVHGGPGECAQAYHILVPDEQSEEVLLAIDDDSSLGTVSPSPLEATPLHFVEGEVPVVSWSALTVDARGNDLDLHRLDRLSVSRLPTASSVAEPGWYLSAPHPDETIWSADVGGLERLDLAHLGGPGPFPGITADASWLLRLSCSTCSEPTSSFVARVEVGG